MSSQYDLNDFSSWLLGSGCARGTARAYASGVSDFASWFQETNGEELQPRLVTPTDLREYQEYLLVIKKRKPGTVNRRAAALRKYFQWAMENNLVSDFPRFPKPVREQPRAPKSLSRLEQNRLLRTVEKSRNARDLAIIRLLISAGLRLEELVSLTVSDVTIRERSGKVTVRKGKGTKYREIPLPSEARIALKSWLSEHSGGEWLFLGRSGRKLTPRAVQKMLKKYACQAGLPLNSVHPHVLRHTCATNMLNAGVDLVKVAAILGHESLDTTAIYTQPRFQDLSEAVEKGESL